ncbi:hypothetical protein EJB05_57904, partial [Eragrostis curvula]
MHPSAILLLLVGTGTFFLISDANSLQARHAAGACIPHEREALLAFKRGITSDPAGQLNSWQEGDQDCCRWRGVRCSNRTGHVLKLRLGNVNINNYEETPLTGQISRSLLALEHLEVLDLSHNYLEGQTGRIPEFLSSLKHLRHLDLAGIPFSGSVPPHLGNLSNLQYLDLSSLSGDMKSTDLSWLTHLPFLQYLNLNYVNLTTVADWPHVLNLIPSLRVPNLGSCSLTSANKSLPHLNLTNIEEIDLSDNYFDHPVVSCWFWNITYLKRLRVSSTGLYGHFPNMLENMTSLTVLDFSNIDGDGPKCIMTRNMRNLCNLEVLNQERNLLYGDVKELFEKLPHCTPNKLRELYLFGNNITGVLPSRMGQLTSLEVLDLGQNNITGHLPSFIGQFTNLRRLSVALNHLIGGVPYEIGRLTNKLNGVLTEEHFASLYSLQSLDLSVNSFDGVLTEEHFASLYSLQDIDLSYNSLKIEISSEWQPTFRLQYAHFATCQMGPLFPSWLQWLDGIVSIDISSAAIWSLPTNMEAMSLREVYLSSNQLLTGQIPPLPRNLTSLDISNNSLTEPLPPTFGVPYLQVLSLFSNHISGLIPSSICKCTQLGALDLANNFFEGELPLCLGKTQMMTLQLSSNSFSGEFPQFLQSCTQVNFLDLSRNKFSGKLPVWIGDLVGLQFLRLSYNRFSGKFPISITRLGCLQYLDLSGNGISGSLPRDMSNLTGMRQLYWVSCEYDILDSYHGVSLSEIIKGQQLYYRSGSSFNVIGIDLSLNNLSATLDAMVNLNLSGNHLSGKIPNKIGAMQFLESLDLSRNTFSGEIPASLSNLTFLSYLDLSYNNLTGTIPSGSQLDTLYTSKPTMYDGNIGLCGAALKKDCSSNNASREGDSRRTEDGHGHETFWFGLGLGFTAGLWVVFCTLLFSKAWRLAYFGLFDRLHDKVSVFVAVTRARLRRKKTTAN